jgi:hypothetical protein
MACSVKQCKKCGFYLGKEDFILFLVIGHPNGPLQKIKNQKICALDALTTN